MKKTPDQEIQEVSSPEILAIKPVVSVVMITYNHEQYLAQAIEGVMMQQTEFELELIISEDCSTDKTRELAIDYQKRFPEKIRVLYSETNVGAAMTGRRAFNVCRGKYRAICDGDDYWTDPLKLAKQVAWLESNPECVLAYHDVCSVDDDNKVIEASLSEIYKMGYSAIELQIGAHVPILTICFRAIEERPIEFLHVANGDTFRISMLGCHGRADFLPDIKAAVYRHHAGGVWSLQSQDDKISKLINSLYWLSIYHRREGRNRVANILVYRIIKFLLRRFEPSAGLAPKWFIGIMFPESYSAVRDFIKNLYFLGRR